jgi:hypothetical protein
MLNGKILNCFYLRERFPQVGPQSRAAESSEAVPYGMLSTLDRVTGGKIIASKKRFKIGQGLLAVFIVS